MVVLPVAVLAANGSLPVDVAMGIAVFLGGIGSPALFYRSSWSWCLMVYYFFAPDRLPGADFEAWAVDRNGEPDFPSCELD